MRPRSARRPTLASLNSAGLGLLCLILGPGCVDEPKADSQAKARPIIGQTTQDVRPAGPELEKGGARVAGQQITATGPITLPLDAYVKSVGKISIDQVKHAIDLYQAEHGEYPKDFAEFKAEIIDAGGVRLPKLPYYQEYGYDEKEHKLIVLEYPDRKAQRERQP